MLDAGRGTCMLPNLVELYVAHSDIDQLQNQNTLKGKYAYLWTWAWLIHKKQGLNIWAEPNHKYAKVWGLEWAKLALLPKCNTLLAISVPKIWLVLIHIFSYISLSNVHLSESV